MNRPVVLALLAVTTVASADEVAPPAAVRPPPGAPPHPRQAPRDLKDPFGDMGPVPSRPMPPKPPAAAPEIAKLGKQLAGSYRCKGVWMVGDGSSKPLEATLKIDVQLDGAWIVASFAESKPGGTRFEEFRTYDATAKQWTRIRMLSTSAHVTETTLGEKTGTWTWEGTATAPSGTTQLRELEQPGGKDLKVWGEALLSGSWQKSYEATCKK